MGEHKALFCKVNKVEPGAEASELEKKHTPVIAIPQTLIAGEFFDVKITVGEIAHPNENEHFIQWIELYIGNVYLGRFDFVPVMTRPTITIPVVLSHAGLNSSLRAVSRCNLHGLWEGTVNVKVEK
ncbi:MAG: class II SORL domain-containing protein [Candidatus Anammoxibacter sp.]